MTLEDVLVRIGSYTGGSHAGRGIVTAHVATDGSHIEPAGVTRAEEPSYLATDRSGRLLYAVGETRDGTLAAFRSAADALEPMNVVSSGGADPCHLAVACDGRYLVAANYTSGSIVVRRLRADGGIGEQTSLVRHKGHGPVAGRQDGPHVHMIAPVPWDDGLLLVTDLGADAVYAYRLDPREGDLTQAGRTAMPPGSGPRHFAFHPVEQFVYVLCELDRTLVTCAWDRATGQLTTLARTSVVSRNGLCADVGPGGTPRENAASAIRTAPDGRFLYTACRGPDTITVFRLTHATAPERAGTVGSGGACPRDIALAANGRLLLCANQESDAVTVFRIAPATGMPISTGAILTTPSPACVQPH